MKIIIIGSKGFIGSHCVNYFKQHHAVYGCDVIVDYNNEQYYQIDATNADFKEVFQQNNFDICINCSGAASVADSILHPRRDFELNVHTMFNLLDAARQYSPLCKFIQLSSAAVYGNPALLPIKEDSPVAPVSPYGWHKLYSEQVCKEFVTFYNSKIAIVRPFSVYGTGLRKQLFWDVYQKIKKDSAIELFGTGKETRDFIHIADLLSLINLIIQKDAFDGNIYNAANGVAISIHEAVDTFVSLMNGKIKYSFNGHVKSGDPLYWQADTTKVNAFGYTPKISLKEGLNEYIKWVQENG